MEEKSFAAQVHSPTQLALCIATTHHLDLNSDYFSLLQLYLQPLQHGPSL